MGGHLKLLAIGGVILFSVALLLLRGRIGGHIAFRRGPLQAPAGFDPLEMARARKLLGISTLVILLAGSIALLATLVFDIAEGAFDRLPITLFFVVLVMLSWAWMLFAWRNVR